MQADIVAVARRAVTLRSRVAYVLRVNVQVPSSVSVCEAFYDPLFFYLPPTSPNVGINMLGPCPFS